MEISVSDVFETSGARAKAMNRPNGVASALGNPRRLLIVKVNGMGDAVMIRSIIEHLRRRRIAIRAWMLRVEQRLIQIHLGPVIVVRS